MIDFYNIPHTYGDFRMDYKRYPHQSRCVAYFDRYLLQKAMSVFEWNIPENWDLNFFLYNLYVFGYVCVAKIGRYGVIPQFATITGFNIFYNPSRVLINNPYLKDVNGLAIELGKDGELLQLTPDFVGILDVVNQYSEMLANAVCAVNTNLFNSRLAYLFYAKNRNEAESYKKLYDKVSLGEPAVFIDSKLMKETVSGELISPVQPFNADIKSTYITNDLLAAIREIEHQFAQKIGLPNANTEKKERLNIDETNKTDAESVSNVSLWLSMINKSIKRINALYPDIKISCKFRFPPGAASAAGKTEDSENDQ